MTRRTLAWLGLVAFPLGYVGVWQLPAGWQQALCGVVSSAGLAAGVGFILDAKREAD